MAVTVLFPAAMLLPSARAQPNVDSPERRALESDLQRYEQLLEQRASDLVAIEGALGDTSASLTQRIRERDAVSSELATKRAERERIEGEIERLDAERAATEDRIAVLDGRVEALKVRVQEMLVGLYKQPVRRSVVSLASSRSFHDLRVRNYYLGLLAAQDADVLQELDETLADLGAERDELERQLAELATARADLAEAEAELQSTQARLAAIIDELNATQAGQLAQQRALIEEQSQLERNVTSVTGQLEQEIARLLEQERRAREAAAQFAQDRERALALEREADTARARADALSEPLPPTTTGFVAPFEGATLVSRFGEGNNSYLAIRAPVSNAAVRAVQTGRVSAITYLGANLGYMLALQHDANLLTVYVNLRQPVVQLGDAVPQGSVIGYLGGGTLTRDDVLQLYAQRSSGGASAFVDPAPLLGW